MPDGIITACCDNIGSLGTDCLLCGETIIVNWYDAKPRICENCKKIWAEIRKERGDKDA